MSEYSGSEELEFYVEVGESPEKLVYNSGWLSGHRAVWDLFSSETLKPNMKYFWRVLAREKGKTKESYGGVYPSSEIWDFTTTSVSPDLAIVGVERLDEIKPGESVRFKVTVKNLGSRDAEPANIHLYYEKNGVTYHFANHGIYTMSSALKPGESETIEVQADFRDEIVIRDGIEYDNILVEGESYIIFDMPNIGNDDFDRANNIFRYKVVYQNKGLPVFEYFTIGNISVYEGNASFPLYTNIGKPVDRGIGNGISFDAVDDFKIVKATIEYRINETDVWHLIGEIANDSKSISVNYNWIVPDDRAFITDSMRIRVKVYEDNSSFAEKISYPFPVYDNRLTASLQNIGEYMVGDTVNLPITIDNVYDLRRVVVTLASGEYESIVYEKSDTNGFLPPTSISFVLPLENSFASESARLIVKVYDIHGNEASAETVFKLNANTDLGDRFSVVVDLFNREYDAYPSGSTDTRTENSIYKVQMTDGVAHVLVSSIAWWKESGESEFSRDFQYFYVTYNTATGQISNPIKMVSIVQRNSGSLPDENVVDFIMSADGKPLALIYDKSDSSMRVYYYDGSKVVSETFDAGENKDSFELMNHEGKTFVVYRNIDAEGNKLLKAKAVYPALEATNSVADIYYGSKMRLHGDLAYFVWSGKAFNVDSSLKITGSQVFDIGSQNKAIYGSIQGASNVVDLAINGNDELVGVYADGTTKVLMSVADSYSLQRTGYLARINAAIEDFRILAVYEVDSESFEDFKIVEIDLTSGIVSETRLSSSYDSTKLPFLVSIEGGVVAIGNPIRGSAYLAIGDFR